MEEKKMTGYPSIDKPWTRSYRDAPIRDFNNSQKFYTLLEDANRDNLGNEAINFMGLKGNSWSYKELFELTNQLADVFVQYGIKENETVLVATVSGMDETLTLLALNKIGAISKWIDITAAAKELEEALNEDNCRIVIAFAVIIPELENCIGNTKVEKVLYSTPEQFIRPAKILSKSISDFRELIAMKNSNEPLPVMPKDFKYISFSDFLKLGNKKASVKVSAYDKNKPILKFSQAELLESLNP